MDGTEMHSFTLEEKQVVQAMRRHMTRRLTSGMIGWLVVIALVLLAVLIVTELLYYKRLSDSLIAMAIAMPVALGAVHLWLVPNLGRKQYRQSPALRATHLVRWGEGVLEMKSERGEARIPMTDLWRWDETEGLILLYQTELFFNIVPKAALGDDADDLIAQLQAAGVKRG